MGGRSSSGSRNSTTNNTPTTSRTLLSEQQLNSFEELRGADRADLINQVSQILNGNVGGYGVYKTKNAVNVGDYEVSLSTRKDKKTGQQYIEDLIVLDTRTSGKDVDVAYIKVKRKKR